MKNLIKQLIPPLFLRFNRISKASKTIPNSWAGNYTSWEEANKYSRGYNESTILEACKRSLRKVKDGEAIYERDSVIFDKIQYSWPLLACLEQVALRNNGQLHLIDFGGSLGSSYFQNRNFLQNIGSLKWIVVEQEHFVECGKKEFEDEVLRFEYSIEDALKKERVHCLLLSGVLQYLPDPLNWIRKLCDHKFDYILIDRTGFTSDHNHILAIQNVPQEIYNASYPCWFFNEDQFKNEFLKNYDLITDFPDSFTSPIMHDHNLCYWKGFFFKKSLWKINYPT